MAYRMNGDTDSIATERNENGVELFSYCTEDSVRLGFEGGGIDAAVWVPRDQVIEFIAILSHIVHSHPVKAEATLEPTL